MIRERWWGQVTLLVIIFNIIPMVDSRCGWEDIPNFNQTSGPLPGQLPNVTHYAYEHYELDWLGQPHLKVLAWGCDHSQFIGRCGKRVSDFWQVWERTKCWKELPLYHVEGASERSAAVEDYRFTGETLRLCCHTNYWDCCEFDYGNFFFLIFVIICLLFLCCCCCLGLGSTLLSMSAFDKADGADGDAQELSDYKKAMVAQGLIHADPDESAGQPGYLSTGQPGYPSTDQPGYPSTGQPGFSSTGQPGYPSTGQPGYPSTGQPGYPSSKYENAYNGEIPSEAPTTEEEMLPPYGQYPYVERPSVGNGTENPMNLEAGV